MIDQETHWPMAAARAAAAKTDEPTVILDVGELLAVTGYFVVTSADNARRVKAITDHIEGTIATQGGPRPLRVEGLGDLHWVLMDYGDFVVHVFDSESRRYFDLERLWADAPRVEWSDGESSVE